LQKRSQQDLAELLERKAAGDEAALGALSGEAAVPDEILGFHAQQAVEKLLKAALAALERDFPRTHDLGVLATLLEDAGHPLPGPLADAAEELTVWAIEFRYEHPVERRLDRFAVGTLVGSVREWAIGVIHRGEAR